jgi:hypothetical protein
MPKRDPRVRLLHMRDYARKALAMVQDSSLELSLAAVAP